MKHLVVYVMPTGIKTMELMDMVAVLRVNSMKNPPLEVVNFVSERNYPI